MTSPYEDLVIQWRKRQTGGGSAMTFEELLDQAIAQYPALAQHLLRDDTGWLNGGYTFVVNGAFTSDPEYPVPPNASVFLVSKASGG
jgi:hypothetical protein